MGKVLRSTRTVCSFFLKLIMGKFCISMYVAVDHVGFKWMSTSLLLNKIDDGSMALYGFSTVRCFNFLFFFLLIYN